MSSNHVINFHRSRFDFPQLRCKLSSDPSSSRSNSSDHGRLDLTCRLSPPFHTGVSLQGRRQGACRVGDLQRCCALEGHLNEAGQSLGTNASARGCASRACLLSSISQGGKTSQRLGSGDIKLVNPASFLQNDLVEMADEPGSEGKDLLQRVFKAVASSFAEQSSATEGYEGIILLDELGIFEWTGCREVDVIRFLRAMQALARSVSPLLLVLYQADCIASHQRRSSLVILYHLASNGGPSGVLRYIIETCHVQIHVNSLISGRSGAVSGEVSLAPVCIRSILGAKALATGIRAARSPHG